MDKTIDHISILYKQGARKLIYGLNKKLPSLDLTETEDCVHYAFEQALSKWSDTFMPDNEMAWLYRVAYNKALDQIRNKSKFDTSQIEGDQLNNTAEQVPQDYLDGLKELDATLAFAGVCCHPALPIESQIALALKSLFAFTVQEIALALGQQYDSIEKRLYRARKQVADLKIDLHASYDLTSRTEALLHILYLCFNEGYYSRGKTQIKTALCADAISLLQNLLNQSTYKPAAGYALLALFCFHFSRFEARLAATPHGLLVHPEQQDRTLFNQELIDFGNYYLNESASGATISPYHLEAAIASVYCTASSWQSIDWKLILNYHQQLQQLRPSLNGRLALWVAQWHGLGPASVKEAYLTAAEAYKGNFYYYSLGWQLFAALEEQGLSEEYKQMAQKAALNDSELAFLDQLI